LSSATARLEGRRRSATPGRSRRLPRVHAVGRARPRGAHELGAPSSWRRRTQNLFEPEAEAFHPLPPTRRWARPRVRCRADVMQVLSEEAIHCFSECNCAVDERAGARTRADLDEVLASR
jgi:hypothetical protein